MVTPNHVAVIMDGNGRWAADRGHQRVWGHVRGAKRVKEIVKEASSLGVQALTLFAFSTENWIRPKLERQILWDILRKFLKEQIEELRANGIRLSIIGQTDRLPKMVQKDLADACQYLSASKGMNLCLALSYGGRADIIQAARAFALDCVKTVKNPAELDEEVFESYLMTRALSDRSVCGSDVDLLIRTSGEKRVSNFLLWQSAYAELVFVDQYWPDFTRQHFRMAIEEFSKRRRRYGGVLEEAPGLTAKSLQPEESLRVSHV